jgi:hypothetical protein
MVVDRDFAERSAWKHARSKKTYLVVVRLQAR